MILKKVIFAVLAAMVMSFGFVSCSSSPEDKLIGVMEDMVGVLKGANIKTADDAKALMTKLTSFKDEAEKITEELMAAYKDKSPEELMKLAETMKPLEEKIEKIQKEGDKEIERLKKQAEDAGLDMEELGSLFD